MKKRIIIIGLTALSLASCEQFLEEEPKGFLTTSQFYQTPNQVRAAVDGAYIGLDRPYTSVFLGLPISEFYSFESLAGFSTNPFGTGQMESAFQRLDQINSQNDYLGHAYDGVYIPMENINSVIANIAETTVIDQATRDRYLGQMYFLRAWYYFHGVRLFGEIPLKLTPTVGIEDGTLPRATLDRIYTQIVDDLSKAEASGLPWTDKSGHVSMGAVKALLAEVYLTMAGFPLQKGAEYYQRAYDKAKEVIESGEFSLFDEYADLRLPANENSGEHIFMIQRMADVANSELHYAMLPSPGKTDPPISVNNFFDPAMLPTMAFYNSYTAGDRRTEDRAYFYEYTPGEVMNYKYWDESAAVSPPSDANIPLIRYADVLLTCAEAKANLDGGSTSDALAKEAWFAVHQRAFPAASNPASLSLESILKERFWEQAFEYKTWFNMIRTRKTLDVGSRAIVDLIGHKATTHIRAFEESDLLLPLPYDETLQNPRLNDPAE
ncbi:MAG TPA: RagB/SusD family nutrient uptake outer membrane protein [Anseongella sp.]|nr:RagB/SusD family nutrient uptake outer membrane protein [Anseongella sp.]